MANEILGTAGNEILTGTADADNLRGYEGADKLYGGDGNDQLDGGQANSGSGSALTTQLGDSDVDYMFGGLGNDTYIVRDIGDKVVEYAGEGIDTVKSLINYTLPKYVEILSLEGTADLTGRGNELDNTIKGNSGNNTLYGLDGNDSISGGAGHDILNGGAGADYMAGGTGDDVYFVDTIKDKVVELAGQGTDLVQSSISYTLGANVERLQLTGTANLNGTGNDLDNIIAGTDGNNIITGGGGHDSLYGDAGADTFVFAAPDESSWDAVRAFETGIDTLQFKAADGYTAAFTVGNVAVGSGAQFVFDVHHNLSFDSNGDAAGGMTLIAGFGDAIVHASDIVLV